MPSRRRMGPCPGRGSATGGPQPQPVYGRLVPPNSFACDRVGLAVWLREPAVKVDAEIAGQRLQLDDPEWSGPAKEGQRAEFAGFLQPAGLIDGPLKVT